MTKQELRVLALAMREHAAQKLIQGCITDCWLDDKVSRYPGNWSASVRVDDLMELCAAVLGEKK